MTTQLSIPGNALQLVEVPAFSALTSTIHATLPTLAETARPAVGHLLATAVRLGLDTSQPMQWIYTDVNGDEANEFQVVIALPIANPAIKPPVGFAVSTFLSFRCLRYTYTGPWADFGAVYDQLFGQLYREGYKNDGQIREVYLVVDRQQPENCVTDIQINLA